MNITRQAMTVTSANTATTAVGTVLAVGLDECESLTIIGALVGHTGGTLDVYIQTSFDAGTTWYDYAHFTQLASGAAAIRYGWHVSRATGQTTVLTLGTGSTVALAAGAILGGGWGNQMRLVTVGGVGTSAGAAQTVHIIGRKQ